MLGIGRNQYIELINQARTIVQSTKKKMFLNLTGWKSPASIRHLLPSQPVDSVHLQPWWLIHLGCVTVEDVKPCTIEEKLIIDYLIDEKCSKMAGELNHDAIHRLYKKGLIFLEVPVNDEDYIQVPPLGSGFVMNRIVGDYFEVLLYKLFVSTDEHTTVGELSRILTLDIELVKQTMSMFLRLGFARKKNLDNDFGIIHTTWKSFSLAGKLQSPPPPKELTTVNSPTTASAATPMDKSLLEWKTDLETETSFSGDDPMDDQQVRKRRKLFANFRSSLEISEQQQQRSTARHVGERQRDDDIETETHRFSLRLVVDGLSDDGKSFSEPENARRDDVRSGQISRRNSRFVSSRIGKDHAAVGIVRSLFDGRRQSQ